MSRPISMVNTRGRVMWVQDWEVALLKQQGAKIIVNPREDYYPQYDRTLDPEMVAQTILSDALTEGIEAEDILEVKEV